MESGFLKIIFVSSMMVNSCHFGITGWDDVVVAKEGMPTTLVCTDTTVTGAVTINWTVKSLDVDEHKLILSARESGGFSGAALKPSMRLTDPKFYDTGVFSLFLVPKVEDMALYTCLMKQQGNKLKERKILLAILTVTIVPAAPIPQLSTLRFIASVNPDFAITKITWKAPGGISMKSEKMPNTGTVAKLPRVRNRDNGVYVCTVHPWANSSTSFFTFNVKVTVDAHNMASFTNMTYDSHVISSATPAFTLFPLTCPKVQGDYVMLYWQPPDTKENIMKPVYQYDRWRGSTVLLERSRRVAQLAGPPYNAESGNFSFLLNAGVKSGGLYSCDVFLNDNVFSQRTLLTILKVIIKDLGSKQELVCQYSEQSQVQTANWNYQNTSRQLEISNDGSGNITTTVSLPITPDTAGNYTCTLELKNGQKISTTRAVKLRMQSTEPPPATTSSLLPSLSALLLLVPLVAASVGVLLWRQKHISDRGIEQSLSVYSGEVENVYDNPDDIRQAPPQGSVYMDLKPRGEDDVYKELERYEQCLN
ncbi:g6f-like isoform X2 [Channa argus]|uniref:g6f-like isoform X2 n=1 Tax=Channa argus TaxID=215402 RepID=UPI0029449148|nr:hypothetical protein Q8A73_007775 [Channa argus]